MTKAGGDCGHSGQHGAAKNKMPFIPQCPDLAQSAAAEDLAGLASLLCLPAKHETPCATASAAVAWNWALEAQSTNSMAQVSTDWGAETFVNNAKYVQSLDLLEGVSGVSGAKNKLFLGTHADHLKSCRANPPCLPGTRGSLDLQTARRQNGEATPRRLYCLTTPPALLPYEGCSGASAMLTLRI